jgi:hypothetical protein
MEAAKKQAQGLKDTVPEPCIVWIPEHPTVNQNVIIVAAPGTSQV